jgi:hypothetical protein
LAGTYQKVFELVREYVTPLGAGIEAAFFGGNAVNFYQLG